MYKYRTFPYIFPPINQDLKMARRTRRKYWKRKSGRWSPNIVKISSTNNASAGEFVNVEDLATNSSSNSNGVAQVFTVKNFEITFTIEVETYTPGQFLESMTAYVMYVPQGMSITSNYYAQHPEYIMTYKYLGSPTSPQIYSVGSTQYAQETQQYQPIRIRTRMSRKLQTGDRVVLLIQGSNQSSSSQSYRIDGIVRWWSKAN